MSEHVLEHLSAYLDGELGTAEKDRFRAHLAECAACARRLEALAALDTSLRELPVEAPAGYFEGLPARVRSRLSQASAPRRLWQAPTWTLAAAAALLIGVLAPLTLSRREPAPAAVAEQYRQPASSPGTLEADRLAALPEAKKRADAPPAELGRLEAPRTAPKAKLEAPQVPVMAAPAAPATAAPAPPPPAAPAAAPPAGFAEPPRQTAQSTQEFGPRANQQAELRKQVPSKSAEAQAEESEVRAEPRPADLKDASAPAERGLTKSDETARRERAAGFAAAARPLASSAYRDLLQRSPRDAAEARGLRESWRRFAASASNAAEVDEARVRVVEMGGAAWRYEGRAEDRTLAEADGTAYLARPDARQSVRVRQMLATLNR